MLVFDVSDFTKNLRKAGATKLFRSDFAEGATSTLEMGTGEKSEKKPDTPDVRVSVTFASENGLTENKEMKHGNWTSTDRSIRVTAISDKALEEKPPGKQLDHAFPSSGKVSDEKPLKKKQDRIASPAVEKPQGRKSFTSTTEPKAEGKLAVLFFY